MNKPSTWTLISALTLFSISAEFLDKAQAAVDQKFPLQDSQKAVEYFENELNFTTNPHGVMKVVDGKEKNVTIVDVRSAEDFAKGHIPGAINIPFEKYNSFDGPEIEFPELRKDRFNYVYCYEHLCNLAQKAAKKFAFLGYPVKEMVGGFEEWKNHKNPIEK